MKKWAHVLAGVALAGALAVAQAPAPARNAAPRTAVAAPLLADASPESVGISSSRLARLHSAMQGFVDRHEAGGVVTLIARDGKVVDVHPAGFQDAEGRVPMRADTIFRIASMTKPITAVAVMMLQEEGKLQLGDAVSKFIPAFKGQRVIGENNTLVPARREITIRDLLSHRSGLSYGFLNRGPVGEAYRRDGITDGLTQTDLTLAQNIDRLAAAPLMVQPGTAWNYSLSSDVLGRVVEVVSGQTFDAFLRQRIFEPLGMKDTAFEVPDSKWSRFAAVLTPDGAGGLRAMKDPETFGTANMSPWAYYKPGKTYFSGGAGLTSTIRDYAQFAQMLLNGGSLGGAQLLSPKTIELMTASQTSDLPSLPIVGPGAHYGLGVRVVDDVGATLAQGTKGMFGWMGIYGTNFWVDPQERMFSIVMVQRYPGSRVADALVPLIYQSLVR